MPSRQSCGMPSMPMLRSMTAASLFLPILARCERPSAASFKESSDQPGCLAHGPEEKDGFWGLLVGFIERRPYIVKCGGLQRFFVIARRPKADAAIQLKRHGRGHS